MNTYLPVKTILIGGSFAGCPHQGHFELIKMASRAGDKVLLFVSAGDRQKNKDEAKIHAEDSRTIWENCVMDYLPVNVDVIFCSSPIRQIYGFLGKMNENGSWDNFEVWGSDDLEDNFPNLAREKYFGTLHKSGRLKFKPISRHETCPISGSQMRTLLAKGMKNEFLSFLPDEICSEHNKIWEILHGRFMREENPNPEAMTKDFIYRMR